MANELKPCLAAFIKWTKQHHADWNLSPVHINGQFSKFMDPDTDTAWLGFEAAWNTRPAAPVEGLETVGEVSTIRKIVSAFAGHVLSNSIKPGDLLCLKSQAEAIIAAKVEQERLRFEGDLDKWMKIIGAGITGYQPEAYALMDVACQELVKLQADNAALTARVKELELSSNHSADVASNAIADMKALETQLAAARKALNDIDNLDQADGHELKLDDAFDAVRIARAALEAKR